MITVTLTDKEQILVAAALEIFALLLAKAEQSEASGVYRSVGVPTLEQIDNQIRELDELQRKICPETEPRVARQKVG